MSCNITQYTGTMPNSGLTDEQNVEACNSYMSWLVNDFVTGLNNNMGAICAASLIGDTSKYIGEFDDITVTPQKGDVVSVGNTLYISKIDDNPDIPPSANWVEQRDYYSRGEIDTKYNDVDSRLTTAYNMIHDKADRESAFGYFADADDSVDWLYPLIDENIVGDDAAGYGHVRVYTHIIGTLCHFSIQMTLTGFSVNLPSDDTILFNIDLERHIKQSLPLEILDIVNGGICMGTIGFYSDTYDTAEQPIRVDLDNDGLLHCSLADIQAYNTSSSSGTYTGAILRVTGTCKLDRPGISVVGV